jgi:hypothetical protein
MRAIQVYPTILAAAFVLSFCGTASAILQKWEIHFVHEKWIGLKGVVLKEGEQVKLPESLWEIKPVEDPDADDVLPQPIVPFRTDRRPIRRDAERFEVEDPVLIRVRGERIEYAKSPRKTTTVPSKFDGNYLSYDLSGDSSALRLVKNPGKESQWRILDAEQRLSKSRGDYQYSVEQQVKFRLEAVGRPGWYLDTDPERGVFLSPEKPLKRFVEIELEKFYDDLSD